MNARSAVLPIVVCAVILPLLLCSTAVAIRFGLDPGLGEPLFRPLYAPWSVFVWAYDWGFESEYRTMFLQGVALAFAPVVIGLVAVAVRRVNGPLQTRRQTPEQQGLGTVEDLRRCRGVSAKGDGVVIGKHGKDVLRIGDDMHCLVLGPSGSGKTVGPVVGTLLEHSGSMLVHDPKCELAALTSRHRSALGDTWIFDPSTRYTHAFNPMLELRGGDHLHGDCEVAATLIACSGTATDPTWENAAAELLTALMLVAFERGQPTLSYVHDLVFEVSAERYPSTGNALARQVLEAHQKMKDRVRDSVNFETRTVMKFMGDPVVRAATSSSEFRAGDLFVGERPTTIYITCPPAHQDRLRPLMRFMVQSITNTALHSISLLPDGREKTRGALFLLDEFATMKRVEALDLGLAVARAYGVRYLLAAQDAAQIKRHYGDKQSVTANMGTIVLMPGFSDSLSDVEKWAGWSMHAARSRGREMLKPLSVRTNESEERWPVLNPNDMALNTKQSIVFHLGARPTWIDRVRWFEEERWRGMVDPI